MADKRVALVTGANRGIGYEVCRQLAAQGHTVILTSRDPAKGEQAVATLRNNNLDIRAYTLDVTSADAANTIAEDVRATFGRLDILVNNAGIYPDEGVSFFDIEDAVLQDTMATNFFGAAYLIRAFMPLMREQHYGRIVNVSSGYGQLAEMRARTAAYKLSKLALNGLTQIVADEVRRETDIKVNAADPGWVRTDMGGQSASTSVEEGADTIVWLATLPKDGPTGGFFYQRRQVEW